MTATTSPASSLLNKLSNGKNAHCYWFLQKLKKPSSDFEECYALRSTRDRRVQYADRNLDIFDSKEEAEKYLHKIHSSPPNTSRVFNGSIFLANSTFGVSAYSAEPLYIPSLFLTEQEKDKHERTKNFLTSAESLEKAVAVPILNDVTYVVTDLPVITNTDAISRLVDKYGPLPVYASASEKWEGPHHFIHSSTYVGGWPIVARCKKPFSYLSRRDKGKHRVQKNRIDHCIIDREDFAECLRLAEVLRIYRDNGDPVFLYRYSAEYYYDPDANPSFSYRRKFEELVAPKLSRLGSCLDSLFTRQYAHRVCPPYYSRLPSITLVARRRPDDVEKFLDCFNEKIRPYLVTTRYANNPVIIKLLRSVSRIRRVALDPYRTPPLFQP